jgi:hypothetical protein
MNLFKALVQSKKTLTDRLLDEVVDYDIYCELTGIEFELGKPTISPIREDDNMPSFSLFIPTQKDDVRPEEVWWRDFREGSGNVFKFVKLFAARKYGIDLDGRFEIIKFIDEELELGLFKLNHKSTRKSRELNYDEARKAKIILFASRPFTRRDRLWWCERGIDTKDFEEANIRSIQYLLNEDLTVKHTFRSTDLAFAQIVYDKVKIYCPESIDFKWRNTCPGHYILGEEQCTRNDVLIITKSSKDIQTFKSLIYCDSISPQGEGQHFEVTYLHSLVTKYDWIFVVMDYDDAGRLAVQQFTNNKFKIRWVSTDEIIINGKTTVLDKDISDYVYSHGVQSGLKHVKTMFPELPETQFRNDRPQYFAELKEQIINE